ncbi:MAG: sulfite exporter TauE/SafE family protein, partial [Asticcacaulis sp.]
MDTFVLFLLVGLLAQIVDGALGMAYGVTSSSVLIALGVPPAAASASVHVAEVFTTGASGLSHAAHKNVKWRLFFPLVIGGVLGGVAGAYLLTGIDGKIIKPFIVAYLGIMGFYILYRGLKGIIPARFASRWAGPLGLVGGFFDAVGGGGWGPTVTSTMVGAGLEPRK